MSEQPQRTEASESLTRRAYERIEEMIVTLDLAPGETVSEAALAQSLGMSRTPVREALQRLAREGLVRVMPRRGLLITEFDVGRQLRMLDVRRQIDRLLAMRAATRRSAQQADRFREVAAQFAEAAEQNDDTLFTRADRAFNELITAAAANEFATEAASLTQGLSRRFWYAHHERFSEIGQAADLHRAIALTIADGNEAAAGAASNTLLDHVEAFTRATL